MTPLKCLSFLVIALAGVALSSCNRQDQQPQYASYATGDPADGNLAPADQNAAQTPQAPASYQTPQAPAGYQTSEEPAYYQPVAQAPEPPPPLPDYSQPACPGENYEWTPGYWDYSNSGYYWVPGAWVMAPWVGALWTPPWWGYDNDAYVLHPGYWGPHIGFYGGVDYRYGYTGHGYYGAYWDRGALRYNRNVTNVNNTTVRNVYDYRVPDRRPDRISYNGGRGGIEAKPSARELAVARDPRTPAVVEQVQHARQAASNRAQFASRENARPAALAAPAPLATRYHAPAARPPAAALREIPRQAPIAHNEPRPQPPANVPPGQQASRFEHSGSMARPPEPSAREPRPTPAPPPASAFNRPSAPTPMQREQMPNRPTEANRAIPRPGPEPRQEPQHAMAPRPQPQNRPEPQRAMEPRPQPQGRPEPQRAMAPRPQPQLRPEPQRAAEPRPQPQRAMAPPPQARPEPQHPMEQRPAPHVSAQQHAPSPHPVPQARPEPQHAPAPAARPAPPKPEERKK